MDGSIPLPPSDEFCAELTKCLPHMRSFARYLCRRDDLADDLVQDATVRALVAAHQFQPGTNFKAWIFTIMHNQNISDFRRRRPLVTSIEVEEPASCQVAPNQIDSLVLTDLDNAVKKLPPSQRKALLLVVVHGLSYEDAARVCRCAVGTIKSRVGRARSTLREMLLGYEEPEGRITEHAGQPAAVLAPDADGEKERATHRLPVQKPPRRPSATTGIATG